MADTLVIRGGTVVDGTGGAPVEADVAIADGRIAAVGRDLPRGDREMDARGLLVTPGFVDIHTHYDAQVTWSSHVTPSSWNGVTTALIGNCGVGFAPCLPERRDMLVKLMEGVEDIPEVVLTEGLPWNWESFPQFLDALGARQYDMDIATQVPHAAVRVHVMGQRAADLEPATEADSAAMAALVAEGLRAGAIGFSTSRTIAHKTLAGEHIPTLRAAEAELIAIARAQAQTGRGWMQVISDFDDPESEFALLRRVAETSGRTLAFSLLQREQRPRLWRDLLRDVERAQADGVSMLAQVMGRPVGVMLGFEISQNPFIGCPSWREVADLPFAARMDILRRPEMRARLVSERTADDMLRHRLNTWDKIFPLGNPPDYEPSPETSVAARARRLGISPEECAYDMLLERDGRAILYRPIINFADGTLDSVREMLTHPHTVLGLGDGGAHVSIICDASAPTYTLTHWTRDRPRGGLMPVAWAVRRLTHDNARAIGLRDRGVVAPGMRADLNLIDFDRLQVWAPEVVYDLPSGGRRLVQRTDGYVATLVAGVPVHLRGEPTGALPGRLVRGTADAA
jgi:N-acyl-D-aspartate/D-glutamate deacylase